MLNQKKKRDGGEKDNGCFIALVPNKTLIIIIIIIIIILLLLFCVKFEFHGWYLKWKEGIWISEKKKTLEWWSKCTQALTNKT